jgi:hypothetical protein
MEDPFRFGTEWLGLSNIPGTTSHWTDDQQAIITATRDNARVLVTSGNAVGKTHVAAFLSLWFLYSHYGSVVIVTSATFGQLEKGLFPEIRAMHAGAKRKLGGTVLTTRINPDVTNPRWVMTGISTDDPSNYQGFHAPNVLIILDEATGIEGPIWEAAGLMAIPPTGKILGLGNPTDASSHFFEECEVAEATGKWKRLIISGENHPNFIQRKVVVPGAITYEKITELEKEYGRESGVYQARVLGQWSRAMGRMFPQFERPVGRHTYEPESISLPSWLSWFASCDIGYAHPSAVLWARYDGKNTFVVREFVKNGLDARELARCIVEQTNAPAVAKKDRVKLDSLVLSFDAFNLTDGPRSRAMELGDECRKAGLPYPTPAKRDRLDGVNMIRTMLNADTLKISLECPKLIAGIKRALTNPDRPEDLLKCDGDDEVDSLKYLLTGNPRLVPTPLEVAVEEETAPLKAQGDYLAAMIQRKRVEDRFRTVGGNFSLGRFLRRGQKNPY